MARHQILTRLADYYHVVWVDPAHGWREAWRRPPSVSDAADRARRPGFQVYTPEPWLPLFYRPRWLGNLTLRARLRRAEQRLRAQGCRRIVVYVFHPRHARALDLQPHDLSIYHIDDEYSFSPVELPIEPRERDLIERVDQVLIHSPALLAKKGGINPNTLLAPNGVDFEAFAAPAPEPADLAPIPRPRVGYSGRIKNQLDWALIDDLTARHPGWSFVFVGPVNQHPEIVPMLERLGERSNVHFLGEKPSDELAAYPQHFDVCIMPYVRDDYTKYIYPLKLHEYLASGRPVVGTPIRLLQQFADVVALAAGAGEWSAALSAALEPGAVTPERTAARQAVARRHDWDRLVRRIAYVFASRLGHPEAARLAEAGRLPCRPAGGGVSSAHPPPGVAR